MANPRSQAAAGHRAPRPRRLRRAELPADTVALARFLIGKLVVRELPRARLVGRIVETEAYLVGDAACHAFRGVTERNRSLFRAHGHAYVYLAYGTSWMLNVSGEAEGVGAGVLIRALDGTDLCARGPIWLGDDGAEPGVIGTSVRIGITKEAERVLRYYASGNPYVSGPRRLNA